MPVCPLFSRLEAVGPKKTYVLTPYIDLVTPWYLLTTESLDSQWLPLREWLPLGASVYNSILS